MIGEVYFVQAEKGPVKIGFSTDVPRRIGQLQSGMREIMTLLAVMPGDRRTEYFFHQKLRAFRITGEWFHPSSDVLKAAQDASSVGLESVPPDYRPLPEYDPPSGFDDDMKSEARYYCIQIAGHRVGSETIRDLMRRVEKVTGVKLRTIQTIWYAERGIVHADVYRALREAFEAREAVRLERVSRTGNSEPHVYPILGPGRAA
ncbi:GIY-YIG nuclease family protein [Ancylobacter oerskovii]|nr:GIY-YIG nuclease family protein [Ancylobacter oerskovii]